MELTKNKKLFLVAICAFIVCIISTVSYAHFFATSTGVSRTTFIRTGHMEITYVEGNVIGSTTNMLPGQYVEKSFSVQNTGTVDMYYSINLNNIINNFAAKDDLVCELIDGSGTTVAEAACPDVNQAIKRHISLPVGTTQNYTLRVTFDETGVNQDDNKGKSFSAKIGLSEDTKPPYTIVSGDIDTVGSIVKIANEEFYVIGQEDEEHVKLLSKWNLQVGDDGAQYGFKDNLQFNGYDYPVPFSSLNYWNDSQNNVKPEYGDYYHAYVYTNNKKDDGTYINSIAEYVDNYVNYLNGQGARVLGRLITESELNSLGCLSLGNDCTLNAPEWVYQTSYWSGTASGAYSIVTVEKTGKFVWNNYEYDYEYYQAKYGVRPVIIIEK